MKRCIWLLPVAGFLFGCGPDRDEIISSDGVATVHMYASIEVVSSVDKHVYGNAQFTLSGPPSESKSQDEYIEFSKSERLWLSGSGNLRDKELGEDIFSGLESLASDFKVFEGKVSKTLLPFLFLFTHSVPHQIRYHSQTEIEDGASEITVSLLRENNLDALNSVVTLPDSFEIEYTSAVEKPSRKQDDIEITWDTTEADVRVELEVLVSCGTDDEEHDFLKQYASDTGLARIPAGWLHDRDLKGECNTTINVHRIRTGSLDSAYLGGVITGSRVRSMTLVTTE